MSKQGSFYEQMRRSEKIKEFRDPLNEIGSRVNFEAFRGALEKALGKQAKGPGGRPRFDSVLMFKILVVGVLYNVSDDALEMRIYDSAFVQKFLGIESTDRIPDAKTI